MGILILSSATAQQLWLAAMMGTRKIFTILCLFGCCFSAPSFDKKRVKRQDDSALTITKFHVNTTIRFRYAITTVTSYVKNPGTEAKKADFSMTIPDTAFISNMSMIIKDKEFVSEVKEKEEAKEKFDEAVASGNGAGLVSKVSRDSNRFSVDANVEPGDKVVFRLTYEELLERRNGEYEYDININPGQVVEDFRVTVNINESLPLMDLKVPKLVESNEIDFDEDGEDVNAAAEVTRGVNGSDHNALIVFSPDLEYQEAAGDQGVSGRFIVSYDVDRSNQESEIQVIDGYFVHFFVPDNLETLRKHVVYVLDISGSMSGQKLEQMKDAMFTVLDDMKETDFFNIITFSSEVSHWNSDEGFISELATVSHQATEKNKNLAISAVLDLNSGGSTNINDALDQALKVGQIARIFNDIPRDVQTMIVFLTDGLPNGDTSTIKSNVKANNTDSEFPIFAIGFGADADFNFLKEIAVENDGIAKKIYEGSDAALQLEDFYGQIASPLLSNLQLNYVGDIVDNSSLSEVRTRSFFKGNEFIVTGKLLDDGPFGIRINGSGKEKFFRDLTICLRSDEQKIDDEGLTRFSPNSTCLEPPVYPKSESQNFLKKLYAFTNIKQLLNKIKVTSDEAEKTTLEERATNLALENNLVTDLTSLVVIKPDSDPVINQLDTDLSRGGPVFQTSGHFSAGFPSYTNRRGGSSYLSSPNFSLGGGLGGTGVSLGNFNSQISFSSSSFSRRRPNPRLSTTTPRPISTTTTRIPTFYIDSTYDYEAYKDDEFLPSEEVQNEPCNGTLTLFTKTYNRGEEIEISQDMEDLGPFDNRAVTAALTGNCCWKIFSEDNFSGSEKILKPGKAYTGASSLGRDLFRNVSSVRKEEISC